MHTDGISPNTLAVLKKVASTPLAKTYYLAGGTACALHFGHRLSYDLDFFSQNPLSPLEIDKYLRPLGKVSYVQNEPGTMNGQLDDVKISFFIYPYTMLDEPQDFESVPIASIKDLSCMKLEVVSSRGSKRDFIDLYQISQEFQLEQQFDWFETKYKQSNVSLTHVLKSLVYFADADPEPMPVMQVDLDWETVKQYFLVQVKQLSRKWGL